MLTRRNVLSAGGIALASAAMGGCGRPQADPYAAAAESTWQHMPDLPSTLQDLMAEFVRYATLAPSTYNSQCWRFRATNDSITILPDPERRSPALDPDDHHLHVSLGCAAENIVQAAAALGLFSNVETAPVPADGIRVRLEIGVPGKTPMAEAMPARQSTRSIYDGRQVPVAELRKLEKVSAAPGVTPVLVTDARRIRRLTELAAVASRESAADPARRAELRRWTRFDAATALATRDGLAPAPMGRTGLPPALGGPLFNLMAASERHIERLVAELRSSPGLIAFVSAVDDRANWVETGRACQRFALLATALGIRHAWVNAPADSTVLRPRLGMELGEPAGRPSVLMRFGYGPSRPRSLRRNLRDEIAGLADVRTPSPGRPPSPGTAAPPG